MPRHRHVDCIARTSRSWLKPNMRARRRRGRPSYAVEIDEEDGLTGAVRVRDAGAQAAGNEGEMRVGVPWLNRPLLGIEVLAAFQPVVLIAGAFGEDRAEGIDVGRDMLGAQPGGQTAIEESRQWCERTSKGTEERRPVPDVPL